MIATATISRIKNLKMHSSVNFEVNFLWGLIIYGDRLIFNKNKNEVVKKYALYFSILHRYFQLINLVIIRLVDRNLSNLIKKYLIMYYFFNL